MTLPAPEIFQDNKLTHLQARIILEIGKWTKTEPDILVGLCSKISASRTRIHENVLILCGKGCIREGNYGWTGIFLGPELDKLREEVEKYEKNI
jgi:uncharacterized protein CbrC (UPF0167 family)